MFNWLHVQPGFNKEFVLDIKNFGLVWRISLMNKNVLVFVEIVWGWVEPK